MGADTCPFIEKGSLSIRWDGELSPCQALLHKNESYLFNRKRTTLAHSFGNVNSQTINDIWRQPDYAAFRDRVLGLDFSFWANEAIFQLMMLTYNLFLLFKMDFAKGMEYRQQIKTFRLKYIFLAGKIIRTARSVVMKLSENYPYREIYEQSLP